MIQKLWSFQLPKRLRSLICIFLLLPVAAVASSYQLQRANVIDRAVKRSLWENIEWLNLLHYQKQYGSYLSQVDDDRYFYAADGKTNPEAELIATITHLFIPVDDQNQQTQCQFVARTQWLIKQLGIDKTALPPVLCTDYLEWRGLIQADSVTMVFPAYHLNSPSSMFGHTLLRLDKSGDAKSEWLSYAVNFGANIDNSDNSLLYAYRGLAGGYPGIFITEPYFKKIQEYNRIEHRDIWEYKLDLTPEETNVMIDHLWELKTINFDYYFFDENCSYRLLELLEVARPEVELTDEFVLTAIPVDTVRAIERAQLISSISYRPAQVTQIQYQLDTMSAENREIILRLSNDISVLTAAKFTKLDEAEQKKMVELAYNYLRYQQTEKVREPDISKRSYQLLEKINSYPQTIDTGIHVPVPTSPEKSHNSKRATIATGKRLDNNYLELGFKMAFHDLEDNKDGFLQGAQINIGSIKIRTEDNAGLRLNQLDLIDIFSLTPRSKFFKPLSWKIYTGFERQLTAGKDQLTYHVTGGAGSSWEIVKNHELYLLGSARLEINKQLKNTLEPAIGFNSGLLSHFKKTTAHLEISGEQFEDNIYRLRAQYIQNYIFSTNHSLKLSAKHQWQDNDVEFSDVKLSYQYYF